MFLPEKEYQLLFWRRNMLLKSTSYSDVPEGTQMLLVDLKVTPGFKNCTIILKYKDY